MGSALRPSGGPSFALSTGPRAWRSRASTTFTSAAAKQTPGRRWLRRFGQALVRVLLESLAGRIPLCHARVGAAQLTPHSPLLSVAPVHTHPRETAPLPPSTGQERGSFASARPTARDEDFPRGGHRPELLCGGHAPTPRLSVGPTGTSGYTT